MKKMLITRPNYDIGSNYLFLWSQSVIVFALKHEWHVEKADYDKAIRNEFESRVKNKPDFIFINGHGSSVNVCGHKRNILVDFDNCKSLKNTITFTRACNCVTKLGKKAVSNGCIAFIGYWKEFWVPRLHSYESTPLKDPLAKPVLEVSNVIPNSLIKGHTVEEAINNSHKVSEKHLLRLITSKEQYDRAILRAMVNNASALSFEGDRNAKIE